MQTFILLYQGPATPPGASHERWPEWFARLGVNLVDVGSPMQHGFVVYYDGSTSDTSAGLNGFSIIQAETRDEVVGLLHDHPYLGLGREYAIEVFEVPKKEPKQG
jgi:hypothetical protein